MFKHEFIGTMIPAFIINIFEIIVDKRESREDGEGGGASVFFGVMFMIGGIIFDFFLAFVLFSYFKNGNQFDNPQLGFDPNQANQQNIQGQPQVNNLRPNNGFTSNPGGLRVGGPIDEYALEGKDPRVVEKAGADLEMSLNGGIDKYNDPADQIQNDPASNGANNSVSADDTPPDDDIYVNHHNKVIDRPKGKQNKSSELKGPSNFPAGHFV